MRWNRHRPAGLPLAAIAVLAVLAVPAAASAQVDIRTPADEAVNDQPAITLAPPPSSLKEGQDEAPLPAGAAGEGEQGQGQGQQQDQQDQQAGIGAEKNPGTGESASPAGNLLRRKPSDLNAALLPDEDKRRAADSGHCVPRKFINRMPDVGMRPTASSRRFPWALVALAVAAIGVVVAAVAAGIARRRRAEEGTSVTVFDLAGATIAILGGLAALAGQFSGVGHRERPPEQAALTVREVYARVPHGEYLEAVKDAAKPARAVGRLDRREIGNVVWLEMALDGYRDANSIRVAYASYGAAAGAGELPRTASHIDVRLLRADHQRLFLPVWVGLPTVKVKFQVQFRLVRLRGHTVRAMTSTGAMRGEKLRYACPRGQSRR